MNQEASHVISNPNDNEYKTAIQSVIDDNMRTDVLGPGICKVLAEHNPTLEKFTEIITKAITKEPAVKTAIKNAIEEFDNQRKGKWVDRGISGVIGVFITAAAALVVNFFTS